MSRERHVRIVDLSMWVWVCHAHKLFTRLRMLSLFLFFVLLYIHTFVMPIRCVQYAAPQTAASPIAGDNASSITNAVDHLDLSDGAVRGDIDLVQALLYRRSDPNKPHPSTRLRPLHYAAARGFLDICVRLIEAGALVDSTDAEDETALLKAAYAGHFPVVEYLITHAGANVLHQDKDGWTVLHNGCSSGDVHMVKFLVHQGVPVNVRSRLGHTPLINAASKGDLAVVEYLLHEADADPLIRNVFGETAYDAAAAAGSAYVCQVLEAAERFWIGQTHEPYDLLKSHVTVPVILHENQRGTSSFLTMGRPTFSSSALGKHEGAWTLYPSEETTTKSHVRLPPMTEWFWLTDWMVDYSHPITDSQGWQYARSFGQSSEWVGTMPATSGTGWVRRRRWIRIMKRRMDSETTTSSTDTADEVTSDESHIDDEGNTHGNSSNNNNNNSRSSSSSSVPASTSLTLAKPRSVFVGYGTCADQAPVAASTASIAAEPPTSTTFSRPSFSSARSSSFQRMGYVWERNEQAPDCRRCGRWFNILVRRHHCRCCGLVVCDKCSTNRVMLPFSHIVQDPAVPMEQHYRISLQPQRACDGCFEKLSRPRGQTSRPASLMMRRTPSTQSMMLDCPVCGKGLDEFGGTAEQEDHVQACLSANTSAAMSGIRYVVYKLPPDSALLGQECVICLEEFVKGDTMARLSCLCTYHSCCIHSWFGKGKECPVHSQ
ncbi:hypothetical protein BX666DRAFT_733099 [Dichotomocladium elegans]|nr:hypothetical protein BX666DRAFT_733099 [Dichotomocladium elegans]